MSLSRRSIETLTDLVEIKLSCLQIFDRDDAREQTLLEGCRKELAKLHENADEPTLPFPRAGRKRRIAQPQVAA